MHRRRPQSAASSRSGSSIKVRRSLLNQSEQPFHFNFQSVERRAQTANPRRRIRNFNGDNGTRGSALRSSISRRREHDRSGEKFGFLPVHRNDFESSKSKPSWNRSTGNSNGKRVRTNSNDTSNRTTSTSLMPSPPADTPLQERLKRLNHRIIAKEKKENSSKNLTPASCSVELKQWLRSFGLRLPKHHDVVFEDEEGDDDDDDDELEMKFGEPSRRSSSSNSRRSSSNSRRKLSKKGSKNRTQPRQSLVLTKKKESSQFMNSVLNKWMKDIKVEKEIYTSFAIFCEVKMRQARQLQDRLSLWEVPNTFRTNVVSALLQEAIGSLGSRFDPILESLLHDIICAIFDCPEKFPHTGAVPWHDIASKLKKENKVLKLELESRSRNRKTIVNYRKSIAAPDVVDDAGGKIGYFFGRDLNLFWHFC